MLNTSRQVGGPPAVAVVGALVADRTHFLHGTHTSLMIGGVTVLTTAATSLLLRAARKHDGS